MPSDLIFAILSLWCLPGAGLNAFSHWAHREQAIVIVSCIIKLLGSPRAGFIVILFLIVYIQGRLQRWLNTYGKSENLLTFKE